MRRRPRVALIRDELAARRDPPSSAARSTRDASHSAGVERRIARLVALLRIVALLLVLPAFGVAAVLLVGPGPDALGFLCIAAGVLAGFIAIDDTVV